MERKSMFRRAWFLAAISLTLGANGQTTTPTRDGMIVRVPALVESKSGELAYDLSVADFTIKDDGIPQQINMDRDSAPRPLSLILVIQTGHGAKSQLSKIARLPDLLDGLLTNKQDQTAVVTFDSSPRLLQAFTADQDTISAALSSISGGSSGAALFDAMHLATLELGKAAPGTQKVIVLISGEHDHGSVGADAGSLIREIASTNASTYVLSFKSGKAELFGSLRSLNPLALTGSAMQKNAGQTLAQMTGGDFFRFDSEREFESRMGDIENHIHNRYNFVFQPSTPRPGLHSLEVEVREQNLNVVAARSMYWVSDSHAAAAGGGSE
jgi:VWFA-related protein